MNDKLNLELAKEYYKLVPKASITLISLLGVTLYFYWGKIPTYLLVGWAGVNFATASIFLVAAWKFKQHGSQAKAGKWLRIYALLLLLQDIPWGVIGPMSFMVDDPLYHMLTLFMLAGMTAGSIITRGVILRIYAISLLSLLTPTIVTLTLQGTPITDAMLAMVLIYTVFMIVVAKNYSASINRNLQLWLDNEQLVEELRTLHSEAEKSNRDLFSEIEHRKQIELELIEAKERSERANKAKDQFLATVSHELRTPLNGIVGFADFLQRETLETKTKHYITQINKAGKILQRIVNDILDITAIEAGHIRLYDEPFSLRAEMRDLLDMLAPQAEGKKLSFRFYVDESVNNDLSGDISRLRQIIGNLLSNALKYTETGHVALNVTHVETRNGKEVLRFAVEDTGVGINEEALEFIFMNFTRLENFETHKSDGMGLGLAIVKSLVQRMDGKLTVNSKPNEGSCFSCELAFEPSHNANIPIWQEQNDELSQEQYQTLNVLVVDDNEINRILLAAFLTDLGIQFTEASCGQEALKLILTGKFNLVLMDIQMPDISGIEVANRSREKLVHMPVMIAVTAHAFPEHRDAILDAGFSYFISKPITMDDLTLALMQTYQSIHLEDDVAELSV